MPKRTPAHGTTSRYQGSRRNDNWAPCRCELCRGAWRRTAKKHELRRLRGIPSYAEPERVLAHIQRLLVANWTLVAIAREAQVGRRTLWNWMNGVHGGMQHAVALRVLALRPVPQIPQLVPAVGTVRRLQALAAMGWSLTWSGREAGISETYARALAAGRRSRVSVELAGRVDAVYRRHCMKPGPSKCAKTSALGNGWVTAVAWDDIDEPAEKPYRPRLRSAYRPAA